MTNGQCVSSISQPVSSHRRIRQEGAAVNRSSSIDLGLAVLGVVNCNPREPLTLEAIAEVCECAKERIRQIEEGALEKLRRRFGNDTELREAFAEMLAAGREDASFSARPTR